MLDKADLLLQEFFDSAKTGKIEKLNEIISKSEGIVLQKNNDSRTALHIAASNNNEECVLLLLSKGSDVNAQDDEGWTALHSAASAGYLQVVKALLSFLPDLELRTSSGCTVLHYAASKGHLEIVKVLLEGGSNIDAKDNYNRTSLMKSILADHEDIFNFLLHKGATIHDVEKVTEENALHMAVNNQNVNICTTLCSQSPSLLFQKNKKQRTPYDESPKELKKVFECFLTEDAKS